MVRTTEDMLNLVPNTLREAATSLGMPRSLVIRHVAYRAVMSGLITGVLAIARTTRLRRSSSLAGHLPSPPILAPCRRCRSSFTNARSPYAEQQKLVWTGALS
jgi:phosphate transport system permease protein